MNPVAEEIESYIGSSSMSGKDFLEHLLFGWCFGEYGNAL